MPTNREITSKIPMDGRAEPPVALITGVTARTSPSTSWTCATSMTHARDQRTMSYARRIVERLKPLDVHKLILFGSQVWGEPEYDSDIDLLVVLDDEVMPQDASERRKIHQYVARHLRDVEREVPIDLIVHTRPMHRRFIERDSMFARKMLTQGTVLYEKSD